MVFNFDIISCISIVYTVLIVLLFVFIVAYALFVAEPAATENGNYFPFERGRRLKHTPYPYGFNSKIGNAKKRTTAPRKGERRGF